MVEARFSALASAVLTLLCACTAEYPETPSAKLQRMRFSTESYAALTKTEVDSTKRILWQDSDEISIFSNTPETGNYYFSLESGAGTNEAIFEGGALPTAYFCALYPFTSGASFSYGATTSTVTLHWNGATQTATPGSYDPSKALMAGCSDGSSIHFRNLCSFVKITTEFECKSIEFYSPDYNLGEDDVTISYTQSSDTVVMRKSTTQMSSNPTGLTLVAPDNGTISPGTYYIAMLPQSLYGFKIIVTTAGGATLTRDATDSKYWKTFKPGTIVNLGTFTASSFEESDGFVGSGTVLDPYIIGNRYQFDLLSTKLNTSATAAQYKNKVYKQTVDIDFNGESASLMSGYFYQNASFTGTYDGGGHKLSNIRLKNVEGHYHYGDCSISALFCNVWNATIKDLTIECSGFEYDTGESVAMFGGFVGVAESSDDGRVLIENCIFRPADGFAAPAIGQQEVNYGSIIGQNQGNLTMIGCTNEASVYASSGLSTRDSDWEYSFGGLIGKTAKVTGDDYHLRIINCRNNGDINILQAPTDCQAGGIIGYIFEDILTNDVDYIIFNAVNRGYIAACCNSRDDDSHSGGIIGKNDADGYTDADPLVINCLNSGSIGGAGDYAYVGGIIGWCYDNDTRVCSCANVGNVYTDDASADYPRIGAICGNAEGEYYGCAYTGKYITYDRYADDDHVHNAYALDSNPPLQLSAEKMEELLQTVPQNIRTEATNKSGKPFGTWNGLWNHQSQQGLDINF